MQQFENLTWYLTPHQFEMSSSNKETELTQDLEMSFAGYKLQINLFVEIVTLYQ